ncbi:MAG: DUF421 domain-containing protein [Clostridia bacterium]|nr:DUF421 domain-containing protein [Clostridia bacterium]
MIPTIIRTLILYIFVVTAVRIMGKRQIGELQPTELVITILLSEVASIPMEDPEIPIINSLIAIFLLVAFEIIVSVISMKSNRLRGIIQGNAVVVIRNGKIDQKELKRLRFTVDDILESLRQKDVFDINEVQYAVAETNGSLSVLLKDECKTVTLKDMKIKSKPSSLPCLIISDGRIITKNFADCNMTDRKLKKILNKRDIPVEEILLLTVDSYENVTLIKKDDNI